ncbi:hypothetical protein pipiens_004532 [Culex pipiens pipiens]|uniref:Uncharacterized protein n=1 Tax=Culex pipiens pipiens TaxID=38569 RepID=A0ABD1CHX2_CULPP
MVVDMSRDGTKDGTMKWALPRHYKKHTSAIRNRLDIRAGCSLVVRTTFVSCECVSGRPACLMRSKGEKVENEKNLVEEQFSGECKSCLL